MLVGDASQSGHQQTLFAFTETKHWRMIIKKHTRPTSHQLATIHISTNPKHVRFERELATRSLREFVRQAWHVVEPATVFVPGWHIDALARQKKRAREV